MAQPPYTLPGPPGLRGQVRHPAPLEPGAGGSSAQLWGAEREGTPEAREAGPHPLHLHGAGGQVLLVGGEVLTCGDSERLSPPTTLRCPSVSSHRHACAGLSRASARAAMLQALTGGHVGTHHAGQDGKALAFRALTLVQNVLLGKEQEGLGAAAGAKARLGP